jgi:hypothetical protein
MKRLLLVSLLTLITSMATLNANASEVTCVDSIHGQLCGTVYSIQDSNMNHMAYGIKDFTLDNGKLVLAKKFSAKFLCREFMPNAENQRPQLPFRQSVVTEKVIIRWTTYANGDCRATYADGLKEISCYADSN